MKLIALAIPLMLSGAAVAQSAPDFTPAPGTTALVPVPDSNAPGGYRNVKITTPASGKVIHPGNLYPQRDNSGVVVISDPAVVPDGWNGVTSSTAMGGPMEDVSNVQTVRTTSAGVPVCSSTITDHCIESYAQTYTGR